MTHHEVCHEVREWRRRMDLTAIGQMTCTVEEAGELAEALLGDNDDDRRDAIGDLQVVAIVQYDITAMNQGTSPEHLNVEDTATGDAAGSGSLHILVALGHIGRGIRKNNPWAVLDGCRLLYHTTRNIARAYGDDPDECLRTVLGILLERQREGYAVVNGSAIKKADREA